MKNFTQKIPRLLLGLTFFIFGGAGLFNLFPPPPDMPEKLQLFMNGIVSAGYFLPFLKLTETVCGFLLLLEIAPALTLVILAPITLNILLVHAFLTPGLQNLVMPLIIFALHITAARSYWKIYQPLFGRNKI